MKLLIRKRPGQRGDTRKSRGFQVRTGLRAGSMLQNAISAIPPTLRTYG